MDLINYKTLKNDIIVEISNRIDSKNASTIDLEVEEFLKNKTFENLIIDLENLEYISSAGLRNILKWKKEYKNLSVINTSLEVYDIFEMTGFTDIIDIKKAYKKYSINGLVEIGHGAKAIVYRIDQEKVIKVYKESVSLEDIERERLLSKKAFTLGLPTEISFEIVKVQDRFGLIFELINAKSLSNVLEHKEKTIEECAIIFVKLLKEFHSINNDFSLIDQKEIVFNRLKSIRTILGEDRYQKINGMVNDISADLTLLHMDFHTNNILLENDNVLIIDMDTLSFGNIIFELANIYAIYKGFSLISNQTIESFLKISIDNSFKFYDLFLSFYLKENNTIYNQEKIELLGLLRVIAHTLKRDNVIINHQEVYEKAVKRIDAILNNISDLKLQIIN